MKGPLRGFKGVSGTSDHFEAELNRGLNRRRERKHRVTYVLQVTGTPCSNKATATSYSSAGPRRSHQGAKAFCRATARQVLVRYAGLQETTDASRTTVVQPFAANATRESTKNVKTGSNTGARRSAMQGRRTACSNPVSVRLLMPSVSRDTWSGLNCSNLPCLALFCPLHKIAGSSRALGVFSYPPFQATSSVLALSFLSLLTKHSAVFVECGRRRALCFRVEQTLPAGKLEV